MTTHYTPKWKDDKGNVVIFPARNTFFNDYDSAQRYQLDQFLWMIPFGLVTAGILEFEADNGKASIVHVVASAGRLGECCVIEGPMLEIEEEEVKP